MVTQIPDKAVQIKDKLAKILANKYISSPYVVPFDQSLFPINLRDQYPGYDSYTLEIGSGWGEFTVALAKKDQRQFIFALEKKKKRVLRSEKFQRREFLHNIRWMVVDVIWFFDEIFLAHSFDKIIINFPDPWPKNKHKKHRLMDENFIHSLRYVTREEAVIGFASDSWSYIEDSVLHLESSARWANKHGKGVVLREVPGRIPSFYEKLQKKDGRNIYYLEYEKT